MKNKETILIVIITTLLVYLLRWSNFLPNNSLFVLLILVLAIVVFVYMQNKINYNYQKDFICLDNLDVVKYIFAILIIILHIRPFLYSSPIADLFFNNIITRTCVPFFFLISGYFIAKKEKNNEQYAKAYIKSTMKLYIKWSVLYIPVLLLFVLHQQSIIQQFIVSINMPFLAILMLAIIFLPLIALIVLSYVGVYYHLWYFPALLLSIWVLLKWKEKHQIKPLLVLSFFLLLFGATETYFGYLPSSLQSLVHYYFAVFFTTRNFLFFALFYVVFGYYLGTKERIISNHCVIKLVLSIALLICEGLFLQYSDRFNSNILIACIPLVYYLFVCTIYLQRFTSKEKSSKLRAYSKYYYLIHPAIILFVEVYWTHDNLKLRVSLQLIIVVIALTHLASRLVLNLKRRYPNRTL